jgi:hypothetical protein
MKVAELLLAYPALEETLIEIAPPFRKLRNPILRRSVAKVATLRHAAAVAQMPTADLIDRLRAAAGQPLLPVPDGADRSPPESSPPESDPTPAWFANSRVVAELREDSSEERMPVLAVLEEARRLSAGEMVELRTSFLPAPGIDLIRGKGFRVWSRRDGARDVRTFVAPPGGD